MKTKTRKSRFVEKGVLTFEEVFEKLKEVKKNYNKPLCYGSMTVHASGYVRPTAIMSGHMIL